MDHLEAIVEIKNIIPPAFTDKIISLTKEKAKSKLPVTFGTETDIRNVNGYTLNFNTPTNLFYWNYIKKEIERLHFYYKSKFPQIENNKVNQIDLLKYDIGGKYEIHTDSYSNNPRSLSVIMNLNDNYEGGNLIFTDQKEKEIKKLKLDKGSIVFFPSNFMYPHSIQPITKGTRYSIVAWLQ
jgi:Rps23 Pro-64 3,4-dihydroxylase Tpa1-like proline 4-hydroxylase